MSICLEGIVAATRVLVKFPFHARTFRRLLHHFLREERRNALTRIPKLPHIVGKFPEAGLAERGV